MINLLAKLLGGVARNSMMVAMTLFLIYAVKMSGRDPREVLSGIDMASLCPGASSAEDMIGCMSKAESMVDGLDLGGFGLPDFSGGGAGAPYYPGSGNIFNGGRAGQPYYPGGNGMFGSGGGRAGKPYQG